MATDNKPNPKKDPENNLSIVDEALVKSNPQLFGDIPKEKRAEMLRAVISITKIHSGPLPPLELIQGYEEIYPGSAKLIFEIFQKQSQHRIKMEDTVVTSNQKQSGRGQIFAFIIAILFLGVAAWVTISGHDAVGGLLGTVDLLGLVAIFITGKRQQATNLQQKNPDNTQLPAAKKTNKR